MPASLEQGQDSLPGLQMAAFLLCPQMVGRGREKREERKQTLVSSYMGTNPVLTTVPS